jgi:glycosyltransferase involved in cell wall biosynthesis
MPLISVLMPVYNCDAYVQAAIDSILTQTFRDFEFIIIDDGSKDRTGEIVKAAAARDPRIKVISRENRGIVPSLNEALAVATGTLIARMDGDDISLPDRFQKQLDYLQAHPDCGLVGTQIMFMDPDGRPIAPMPNPMDHEGIVQTMLDGIESVSHPTVLFRTDVARSISGYSDRYEHAEDMDFFLRMAEATRVANMPDLLLHYRQHAKSIGRTKSEAQAEAHYRAICDAAARTGRPKPKPIERRDYGTETDDHARWAWWALQSGQRSSARFYARKVLAARPFAAESWRLLYCVLRGR